MRYFLPYADTPRKIADYYHSHPVAELADFEDWLYCLDAYNQNPQWLDAAGVCFFVRQMQEWHNPISSSAEWDALHRAGIVPSAADSEHGYTSTWVTALAAGLRLYVKECTE